MTIVGPRVKVSFTKEELDAFSIVADIIKGLRVKEVDGFIEAVTAYDSIFYDEFGDKTTVFEFEFLNNMDKEEEEE